MYRSAANTLKTDDKFEIAFSGTNALTISGGTNPGITLWRKEYSCINKYKY
ncbi:MAG: hypothetical protein ACW99A_13405 [Candidatus Kariarchaeaceae archaeon]